MNKYINQSLKKEFNSKFILGTILILVFLCFYVIFKKIILFSSLEESIGNFEKIIYSLKDVTFFSLTFIVLFNYIDFYLNAQMDSNVELKLRFKTQKEFNKSKKIIIFCTNTILYILTLIILISITNITNSGYIVSFYGNYNMTNYIYMFYVIIKTYILMLLITCMIQIFSEKKLKFLGILILMIITISNIVISDVGYIINSDNIMYQDLLLSNCINARSFASFSFELIAFLLCCLIILVVTYIIKVIFKKVDDKHENKS